MDDKDLFFKIKKATECNDIEFDEPNRSATNTDIAQTFGSKRVKSNKFKYVITAIAACLMIAVALPITINYLPSVPEDNKGNKYTSTEITLDDLSAFNVIYPSSAIENNICYEFTDIDGSIIWLEVHSTANSFSWSEYIVLNPDYKFNDQSEFDNLDMTWNLNNLIVKYKETETYVYSSFCYNEIDYYVSVKGNFTELQTIIISML